MTDKLTDRTIEACADLWCRALRQPKYDNGDHSERGDMGMAMMTMNASRDRAPVDMDKAIPVFREHLVTMLKAERDAAENRYFNIYLDTDYAPCEKLAEAARRAGIPASQFSIKSTVCAFDNNHVSCSFGYGAPRQYWYPYAEQWILLYSQLHETERDPFLRAVVDGHVHGIDIKVESQLDKAA